MNPVHRATLLTTASRQQERSWNSSRDVNAFICPLQGSPAPHGPAETTSSPKTGWEEEKQTQTVRMAVGFVLGRKGPECLWLQCQQQPCRWALSTRQPLRACSLTVCTWQGHSPPDLVRAAVQEGIASKAHGESHQNTTPPCQWAWSRQPSDAGPWPLQVAKWPLLLACVQKRVNTVVFCVASKSQEEQCEDLGLLCLELEEDPGHALCF